MCCEHLICAACARPVVEARCTTCRSARAEMHGDAIALRVPEWLAAGAVLLVTLTVLLLLATRQ